MAEDKSKHASASALPPLDAIEREGADALAKAVHEIVRDARANGGQADLARLQRLGPAAVTLFVKTLAADAVPHRLAKTAQTAAGISSPGTRVAPAKALGGPSNTAPKILVTAAPKTKPQQHSGPATGQPQAPKNNKASRVELGKKRQSAKTKTAPVAKSPTSTGWADQRRPAPSFTRSAFYAAIQLASILTLIITLVLYALGQ